MSDDTEPIYLKLDSEEGIASLLTMDDFTAVYELADKTRRRRWAIRCIYEP